MKKLLILLLLLSPVAAWADPISAIVGLASIAGSGVAVTGFAGLTLASGAMLAGGVLTLAGSITGNKKLAALGSLVGVAGGIGSMLSGSAAGAAGGAAADAGETASAGAKALAQTPAAGGGTVAGGEAAAAADAGEAAVGEATNSAATQVQPSATKSALYGPAGYGATSGGGVLDQLAAAGKGVSNFVKKNSELVNLGGGLLKGAAEGYSNEQLLKNQQAYQDTQRARFNQSVQGITPQGQFIDPNANVTNTGVQDPTRYVPRRAGIIRSAATPVQTPNQGTY